MMTEAHARVCVRELSRLVTTYMKVDGWAQWRHQLWGTGARAPSSNLDVYGFAYRLLAYNCT